MALAAALGGFLSGAAQGYDRQIEQNRQDTRDKREAERFDFEKKEMQRREDERKRQDEIRSRLESLNKEFESQSGVFAQFAEPKQEQPTALATAPVTEGGAPSPAPQSAIAVPGDAAPAPAQPPKDSFLSAPMAYRNPRAAEDLYYQRLGGLLKEDYANKGDLGRAALVDGEIAKLRDAKYEPVRRLAAATAISGAAPEALEPVLNKAYGTIEDGKTVKVTGMKVDEKTGLPVYGLQFIDRDGKTTSRELSGTAIYGMLRDADALQVVKFNLERGDTAKNFELKTREVAAGEKGADAKMISARADQTYRATQARVLDENIKGGDVKARVQAIEEMFPLANKQLKIEDLASFTGKNRQQEIDAYKLRIDSDTKGRRIADNLASLNPKVDPRILGGAAKAAVGGSLPTKQIDKDTGRSYFQYGGQKIFVN